MHRVTNAFKSCIFFFFHLGEEIKSLVTSYRHPSATVCFSMMNVFAVKAEGQNLDAVSFGARHQIQQVFFFFFSNDFAI